MTCTRRANGAAAIVAAFSLLIEPAAPLLTAASAGQTAKPPVPAQTPAQTPAAKPAATTPAAPIDGGWPRMYDLPSGGSILLYQPQVSSWEKQSHIVALSAVSYRPKSGEKPAYGTIRVESDTKVSVTDRLVNIDPLKIVEANFQTLSKEQVREITAEIDKAIPKDDRVIALDRVLANIDKSQIMPKNVEGIKAD